MRTVKASNCNPSARRSSLHPWISWKKASSGSDGVDSASTSWVSTSSAGVAVDTVTSWRSAGQIMLGVDRPIPRWSKRMTSCVSSRGRNIGSSPPNPTRMLCRVWPGPPCNMTSGGLAGKSAVLFRRISGNDTVSSVSRS